MKKSDLSTIMRRAWAIARETGRAFAEALSKSWELYRLTKRMRAGVVRFAYQKTDLTIRQAIGTLKDTAALVKGTGHATSARTVRYYDLQARGFRSFRAENLVAVY